MGVLDFVFPKSCLGCGKLGKYVCRACLSNVQGAKNVCVSCFKPSVDGLTHFRCKRKYLVDGVFSCWEYKGVVRDVILTLKYKFASDVAREISDYFVGKIKESNQYFAKQNCLLVPIPLYKSRENWRGFNQSEILGRYISEGMEWGYCPSLLKRIRPTQAQVGLKKKERMQNIKEAFGVNLRCTNGAVLGKTIVVFDDVMTTTATIKEAGKTLRRAGYKNVYGLTLAK